jgi:hypothetical protein
MVDKYPLPVDILAFCQGHWDDSIGKFVDSNSQEVIDCCENTCRDSIEFCFEYNDRLFGPQGKEPNYQKYKQNLKSCQEMIDDCQGTCFLYPSKGANIVRECAKKSKCDIFPIVDKECLKKEKDSILECCKEVCNSDNSIDCNSYQKFFDWVEKVQQDTNAFFSNYIPGSDEASLMPILAKYDMKTRLFSNKKISRNQLLVVYFVVVCLLFLGIYLIVKIISKN